MGKFAHAALRAQPLDYLKAVGQDFARYVFPEHYRRRRSGETQAHYFAQATLERDAGFVRISRSGLVNLARIRSIHRQPGGRYQLSLDCGTSITSSRRYQRDVREAIAALG